MHAKIYLNQTSDTKPCLFNLNVHGVELSIEVSPQGKVTIANIEALAEQNKHTFKRVIGYANSIVQSTNPQALICQLQIELAKKYQTSSTSKKPVGLNSKGENPFDYYYVSSQAVLPRVVADSVPSINVFMQFLAAIFLIPGVTDSSTNVLIAIAFSGLALSVQLFSSRLEQKIGANYNRIIQDVFSATTLSITTFSSIRTLGRVFIDRALILAENDHDMQANFVAGIAVLVLAILGALASLFMPSVAVMGPRVQATALNIERVFLANNVKDINSKRHLMEGFKQNEGNSLANRLCHIPRKKIDADAHYDERVIIPPTLLVAAKRMGSAFISAVQFSLAFGINPGVLESILVPMSFISLLHAFVNREFQIKAGRKNLYKTSALSDQSIIAAKGIKWISESAAVSYNSLISPAIAFFFVFDKLLQSFDIGKEGRGTLGAINGSLLVAVIALNIPSLILDLNSRHLGVDRFEGWSALRLSYILDAAKNQVIRQNLTAYLELLITSAQFEITLTEGNVEAPQMTFFNNPGSRDRIAHALSSSGVP